MATESKRDTLPDPVSKYRRYAISFGVTLVVGLSPLFVSRIPIPGFTAILNVFPRDIQSVIPFAAMLMTLPAIGVQFFGRDTISQRRLKRAFVVNFAVLFVLIFILYVAYEFSVIRIEIPAVHRTEAYVTGSTMLPSCPCANEGLDIRDCIGTAISVSPGAVTRCYPQSQIRTRTIVLSLLYMLLMFSLGMLIGLLVQREAQRRARKHA
jgi:hypothetical protein